RLDLETELENLSVGEEQQVEILKLLYRKANVLILDEPTAVLTPQEVDLLFERLKELNRAGRTIIIITHKLHEILHFTKNVTVMRQGKVVTTLPTKELDEPKLAELIIGRKAKTLSRVPAKRAENAIPVLSLKNVSLRPKKSPRPTLDDLSFDLYPGEVLGVAGISGNGQQELIEILSGIESRYEGEAILLGRALKDWQTYDIKQKGFGLIPADRNEDGLVGSFPVQDNLTLGHHLEPRFSQGLYRSNTKIAKETEPLLEKYDIRPRSLTAAVGRLSGGNQQKVIIAREIDDNLKFLLAAYPTRGVDIGAIEFIHDLFQKKKQAGAGILLISSELEELFQLSDRLLVLYDGKIAGVADPKTITPRDIGLLMTGCKIA
ncbi:MAG: ATP-binding cassette domain-containing protein, partial [Verrucomicrobiales bacterium]